MLTSISLEIYSYLPYLLSLKSCYLNYSINLVDTRLEQDFNPKLVYPPFENLQINYGVLISRDNYRELITETNDPAYERLRLYIDREASIGR